MKTKRELFADLETNAGKVIDDHLDMLEVRMTKLEKKERWRDVLALVQEYREWGQTEQGEDYNMMWLEDLNKYRHLMDCW